MSFFAWSNGLEHYVDDPAPTEESIKKELRSAPAATGHRLIKKADGSCWWREMELPLEEGEEEVVPREGGGN